MISERKETKIILQKESGKLFLWSKTLPLIISLIESLSEAFALIFKANKKKNKIRIFIRMVFESSLEFQMLEVAVPPNDC